MKTKDPARRERPVLPRWRQNMGRPSLWAIAILCRQDSLNLDQKYFEVFHIHPIQTVRKSCKKIGSFGIDFIRSAKPE